MNQNPIRMRFPKGSMVNNPSVSIAASAPIDYKRSLIRPPLLQRRYAFSAPNPIGCITVDGQITEYPIPTEEAEPHRIILAPDGAIWFAEECNQIGRLSYTP